MVDYNVVGLCVVRETKKDFELLHFFAVASQEFQGILQMQDKVTCIVCCMANCIQRYHPSLKHLAVMMVACSLSFLFPSSIS